MIPVTLTPAQIADIIVSLGGKLPPKRVLGEGFTGLQRLELRQMLEGLLPDERSNRAYNPSTAEL